jgi:large conductance mechanosensitive channel
MDLAVGIIIGTAFTAIVKSLVNDIIMPLIGAIIGGVNFTHLRIIIRKATVERPELALTYGNFLQNVIDFLIIAFVVFMIVRTFNSLREKLEKAKKQEEAAAAAAVPVAEPVVPADIVLLTEIRDLLQKKESV